MVVHGFAIQSRVTTEDPLNNFMPDTGKIMAYRSGGGFGVRLDTGNSFQGAVITPYYDSLLVKVTTWALTFEQAAAKMERNLKEFRIRGIKTNIPFLENVVKHKTSYQENMILRLLMCHLNYSYSRNVRPRNENVKLYWFSNSKWLPRSREKEKPIFPDARIPCLKHSEPIKMERNKFWTSVEQMD